MFDREGRFVTSNATGYKRLNLKDSDLIGRTFYDFMSESLASSRQEKLNKVFSSGQPVQFQDEREGIIFNHTFYPVFENNEITRVVTYSQDITESKKTENELIRSRQEWIETFDMIPDLIAIIDTRHRIVRANKAMLDKLQVNHRRCKRNSMLPLCSWH